MAGYFNFGDPILMALLQAVYRSPQQIPQSLQQGAFQPLAPPDPTFGLNQSPQYRASSPVEQSLSRGANIRDLSIQTGLANNPEDVYAAGIRNEQPDLIELARAAMERYGLQSKLQSAENIAQTNAQADVQKTIAPAEIAAEASQRNKLVELETEKLRQAGGNAKTEQEAISSKYRTFGDSISKILNNENMTMDDRVKAVQILRQTLDEQIQTANNNAPKGVTDPRSYVDEKLKVMKPDDLIAEIQASASKNPVLAKQMLDYIASKQAPKLQQREAPKTINLGGYNVPAKTSIGQQITPARALFEANTRDSYNRLVDQMVQQRAKPEAIIKYIYDNYGEEAAVIAADHLKATGYTGSRFAPLNYQPAKP